MSTYTINNTKPVNTHNRTNFIFNNRSISVYTSNKAPSYDPSNYPNNILMNYHKKLILQNPETTISPDYTLTTKDTISTIHPVHLNFGIPNTANVFSFPPLLFLRYFT